MNEPILQADSLGVSYGRMAVLKDVRLSIRSGEFVVVVGPNGAGKSTLVKALCGFHAPSRGSVRLAGRPLDRLPRREAARFLAIVPQETPFEFPFRVLEFVLLARHPYRVFGRVDSEDDLAAAREALEATGTWALKDRSVLELSGGERQRVVLASALAQRTPILLLDEPTASLDLRHQIEIFEALKRRQRETGLTVLAVTHDINLGLAYADRAAILVGGRVVADGPTAETLTAEAIRTHFGVAALIGRESASGRPVVLPVRAEDGP
ncbi:MAG: ABC transporter ATP-binding protein [Myxococcales bacterium]|nr:MAG: ABC transporter ATP-binding protein [Myxococcales bacterium]